MTTRIRGTLDAAMLGATVAPIAHEIDARWLMAYAAALGETDPRYYDTLRMGGPLAHPVFPVCYEWPVAVALRDKTIAAELQPQSVHATHHLTIHRAPRAGDTLQTTARIIEVAPRRSGTLVVSRFETVDARGEPVSTTDYGSVYRDVALAGSSTGSRQPQASGEEAPAGPTPGAAEWREPIDVPANAAWVYTECAQIWNPIHTDIAIAQRAGLSAPILHGTATLALAVSRVVARELGGDPERVRQVSARFTGMVPMPARLGIRVSPSSEQIAFEVTDAAGARVLSDGLLHPGAAQDGRS